MRSCAFVLHFSWNRTEGQQGVDAMAGLKPPADSAAAYYKRAALGIRMQTERKARGYSTPGDLVEAMRERRGIEISARQYADMERGYNQNGRPVYMRLDVMLAFVEIVRPPNRIAFLAEVMDPTARRILGIPDPPDYDDDEV